MRQPKEVTDMKLYEAIETIINEFGKDIVTNANVVNVFNDYNAFEESRTFKVILKNLIAEGYMDQLMYVRDWESNRERITNNFIAATSFDAANASYVIKCLGYGLGYTKEKPVYELCTTSQPTTSHHQKPNATKPSTPKSIPLSVQGVQLDKTESQIDNLSEAAQHKYKEAAEAYLEDIIEYKSDIEKDLGVHIQHSVEYASNGFSLRFEINGKIKIKYEYSIIFNVLIYDASNRVMGKQEAYIGTKKKNFEIGDVYFAVHQYHKVSNIKRIVVYWEEE